MKNTLRLVVLILLFFLAIIAFWGSWGLIGDPSGKSIQIPIELLDRTPFKDYLIPGIILFLAIGVLSLLTVFLTIKNVKYYPWFIIIQGFVLMCWLTIELILNIEFFYPFYHYSLYTLGIFFIVSGLMIRKRD